MEAVNRTILLANFYGDGKHLYQDELGWWPSVKEEAHSQISRDIFYPRYLSSTEYAQRFMILSSY